jgi:hypothetical protein
VNQYEKSAIVGYHLSGASNELIAHIMNITKRQVENIIKEYFKHKKPPIKSGGLH